MLTIFKHHYFFQTFGILVSFMFRGSTALATKYQLIQNLSPETSLLTKEETSQSQIIKMKPLSSFKNVLLMFSKIINYNVCRKCGPIIFNIYCPINLISLQLVTHYLFSVEKKYYIGKIILEKLYWKYYIGKLIL